MIPLSATRIARLLEIATRAVSSAAPAILAGFRSPDLAVERKADGTAVTRFDREAEWLIREALRTDCDNVWPVLGEELGDDSAGAQLRWVIDPIDGTLPYSRGLPHFGTLVAFEDYGAARALLGVINLPVFAELYTACSGQGARCNGDIIHVAPHRELSQCIVSAPAAHVFARAGLATGYERLCGVGAIMLGNADCWMHAMAARGAVDVVIEFGLSRWDIAASEIVVTEAGGRCLLRQSRTQAGKYDAVLGSAWGAEQVAALLEFDSQPAEVAS